MATATPTPSQSLPGPSSPAARLNEQTALARVRTNFNYLISPSKSSAAPGTSLRLRFLLRTLHSIGTFLFWRFYRWAKYAIIGSAIAALGTISIGGVGALGVLAAPTGIVGSAALGTVWGVGRWAWKRVWNRGQKGRKSVGVNTMEEEGKTARTGARNDLVEVPW